MNVFRLGAQICIFQLTFELRNTHFYFLFLPLFLFFFFFNCECFRLSFFLSSSCFLLIYSSPQYLFPFMCSFFPGASPLPPLLFSPPLSCHLNVSGIYFEVSVAYPQRPERYTVQICDVLPMRYSSVSVFFHILSRVAFLFYVPLFIFLLYSNASFSLLLVFFFLRIIYFLILMHPFLNYFVFSILF